MVGASIWRKGTVISSDTAFSDRLPVSGSTALTSNWLRPRRSSTVVAHAPSASALTVYGSRPGVAIEIVAPGADVPLRTYWSLDSSTWTTAAAGSLTAIVGGLAKRRSR